MQLSAIETLVLQAIGFTRYSELSVATDTDSKEDFANLHKTVLFAREEIKLNCNIPGLLKRSSANATVSGQRNYSMPTDFDLPKKVIYRGSGNTEFTLDQVYSDNLLQKLNGILTTATGTPALYMMFGNSSDVLQMELYSIPNLSTDEFDVLYLPILENLTTSTDEDILMQKYALTVTKLATAYAFYLMRKDKTQFDIWLKLGFIDFAKINQREQSGDHSYKPIPDSVIRQRRQARFTR